MRYGVYRDVYGAAQIEQPLGNPTDGRDSGE
jgi:hypothetical protein